MLVGWGELGGVGGRKLQYCGGCSVQWGIESVHVGDNISTVDNNISTVRDNISTVENNIDIVEDNISTMEDNISTVEGIQYYGGIAALLSELTAGHVGDTFSTVKVVQ